LRRGGSIPSRAYEIRPALQAPIVIAARLPFGTTLAGNVLRVLLPAPRLSPVRQALTSYEPSWKRGREFPRTLAICPTDL